MPEWEHGVTRGPDVRKSVVTTGQRLWLIQGQEDIRNLAVSRIHLLNRMTLELNAIQVLSKASGVSRCDLESGQEQG